MFRDYLSNISVCLRPCILILICLTVPNLYSRPPKELELRMPLPPHQAHMSPPPPQVFPESSTISSEIFIPALTLLNGPWARKGTQARLQKYVHVTLPDVWQIRYQIADILSTQGSNSNTYNPWLFVTFSNCQCENGISCKQEQVSRVRDADPVYQTVLAVNKIFSYGISGVYVSLSSVANLHTKLSTINPSWCTRLTETNNFGFCQHLGESPSQSPRL